MDGNEQVRVNRTSWDREGGRRSEDGGRRLGTSQSASTDCLVDSPLFEPAVGCGVRLAYTGGDGGCGAAMSFEKSIKKIKKIRKIY